MFNVPINVFPERGLGSRDTLGIRNVTAKASDPAATSGENIDMCIIFYGYNYLFLLYFASINLFTMFTYFQIFHA